MQRFLSIAAILVLLGAGGSAERTGPLQARASNAENYCEYWACYGMINGQNLVSTNGPISSASGEYLQCNYKPVSGFFLYQCIFYGSTGYLYQGTGEDREQCPGITACSEYSKRGLRELDEETPKPAATMLTQQEIEDRMPW